jgi:hypothetical protein
MAVLAVSATASYLAVDTLYPGYRSAFQTPVEPDTQPTPEAMAVATAKAEPAFILYTKQTFGVDTAQWRPALAADLPAPSWTGVPEELGFVPDLRVATLDADAADANRPAATTPTRSFGSEIVFSSMSSPTIPTDEMAGTIPETALAALSGLPGRLIETAAAITPAALAALSTDAVASLAPATLAYARPDTVPLASTEPAPVIELAALTTDIDVSPDLRPQPRPEAAPVAVAAPTAVLPPDAPTELAVLTSLRPEPRPANLRIAVAAPAPTPAPAAAPTAAAPVAQVIPAAAGRALPRVSGDSCGRNHARAMPGRSSSAPTGSAFFAAIGNASGGDRDNRIINELARGNMPGFLHQLEPVVFQGQDARGAPTQIVICVTPDYLALGSDRDFVRVPLGLPAAAAIAGQFGMTLPTPRMVDAIYAQAQVRLSPAPMQPGPQMSSTAYFLRHNATIEGQRQGRGGLISGHKKDVVMASRMASNPGRVAIYGWHRAAGNPIQPVSTVHGASYADYSHGIRLVSRTAYLNGKAVDIDELLGSGRYAYLLNSDGPLPGPVIRIASR